MFIKYGLSASGTACIYEVQIVCIKVRLVFMSYGWCALGMAHVY